MEWEIGIGPYKVFLKNCPLHNPSDIQGVQEKLCFFSLSTEQIPRLHIATRDFQSSPYNVGKAYLLADFTNSFTTNSSPVLAAQGEVAK